MTATQLRELVQRLVQAGQWKPGDPEILIVCDAGYDTARLAYLLADLPVEVLGRLRSDRVLRLPAPPRAPAAVGRPRRHGGEFHLADPATWPAARVTTSTETTRYGTAIAQAWDRLHPRLTRRAAWLDHDGDLPILEGTLIRLMVEHLPGERNPKPVWLWSSRTNATPSDVDKLWQAFLRRFDLEHTFRMFKQTLGWTAPKLRDPQSADRWTWLVIAAHTQLRLARDLATDLRRPWERPVATGRLSPARVRRGFRHLRQKLTLPASAPKPTRPGPGRPPGSKEPQTRITSRRRQDHETRPDTHSPTKAHGLNGKLRHGWNADWSQDGNLITAISLRWNGELTSGGDSVHFGHIGTFAGSFGSDSLHAAGWPAPG